MRVVFLVNHAADYHEKFFYELAKHVDLTVIASNCENDGLKSPACRSGYDYIEPMKLNISLFHIWVGSQIMSKILKSDIIVSTQNVRNISILLLFLSFKLHQTIASNKARWFWWGLIFGKENPKILNSLRYFLTRRSSGILAHSPIVKNLAKHYLGVEATNYNNAFHYQSELVAYPFNQAKRLKLLFAGTIKERKKIPKLVSLAKILIDEIEVRIVGNGTDTLTAIPGNVTVYDHAIKDELAKHFDWCDLTICTGNVGLLAVTGAGFGRGLIYDPKEYHGPEISIAIESEQFTVDFGNLLAASEQIRNIKNEYREVKNAGMRALECAKLAYNVENMVDVHLKVFSENDQYADNKQ